MKRPAIKINSRTVLGKKVKRLRKEGMLPVNVYGKDMKSKSAQVELKLFKDLFKKVHETGLVDVEFGKDVLPSLIHNVQIDPVSQEVIHADFYKVDLKEKIKANIPVIAKGEAPAVMDKKGILLQILSEIEVEALPSDLPERIEVDVSSLSEVDQEIPVSSIAVLAGVTILNDPGQILFKIGELVSKEAEEQAKEEQAAAEEAKAAEAPTEVPQAEETPAPQVQEEKK